MNAKSADRFRFGNYELDCRANRLFRDGWPVKIQPQPLKVLEMLLDRPGEIVSREDLRTRVWDKATFVEFDQGLNYCIRQIRLALRDDASEPAYVETLPKQGYRFIAPVNFESSGKSNGAANGVNNGTTNGTNHRTQNGIETRIHDGEPITILDVPRGEPGLPNGSAQPFNAAAAGIQSGAPEAKRGTALRTSLVISGCAVVLAIASSIWFYQRAERRTWASTQAPLAIAKLTGEAKPLAAYSLFRTAVRYAPEDSALAKIGQSLSIPVSIQSSPAGAAVAIQDYDSPDGPWLTLGTTPLQGTLIPNGFFRWKVTKQGVPDYIVGRQTALAMTFDLQTANLPPGMVRVSGGTSVEMVDFIGPLMYQLPAFDMDRYEVTNRQYQNFLDDGGYAKREYWKEKFVRDGKELAWEQAVELFRDSTDRPGPSTWEGGHYPAGQADYPVAGVSWYEASAYAAYVGKSLPVIGQWLKVAPGDFAPFFIPQSNFGQSGTLPVGATHAVGPYGTYDMAGNVREWIFNAVDNDRRFILGGAWRTQTYQAFDPEALLPFDRSPLNGFRCVLNKEKLTAHDLAPIQEQTRDFSKAKPASDEVFRVYKEMYKYDRTPLNTQAEGIAENTADWTKQKVTIDAGHDNQHLPIFLFLPKNVRPPFQTVVFFPSARVNLLPNTESLGDLPFVDYIIKSGRAVLYPIYEGTYGRNRLQPTWPGGVNDRERVIAQSKEVRRSVDYLETRTDVDNSNLAYLGVSQGTAYGVIFAELEERFKTVVLLDGGFFLGPVMPGRDQADFAPRIKRPVLMVNGRYDFTFSPERSQNPLFRMLGTPDADKRHVMLETPHDISQKPAELSKEVLAWLDKYLGRVNVNP